MDNTRELRNDIDSAGNKASAAAHKVTSKAQHVISDMANSWTGNVEEVYRNVQDRARQAADASEDFVHKHPFSTVMGAAAIGLLAGLIMRRRH